MRPSVLDPLFSGLAGLPGVGPKTAKLFDRLLGQDEARVLDLLFHLPTGVVDNRLSPSIREAPLETHVVIAARVAEHRIPRKYSNAPLNVLVEDDNGDDVLLVFFRNNFDWVLRALPVGEALLLPAVLTTAAVGAVIPTGMLPLLRPVAWLLDTLFALPEAVARWPLASVALPMPTATEWVLMTMTVVAACGRRGRDAVRVLCVGALVVAAAELAHRYELHPRGVLRVTALDVGQGDAIVVELPDGEAMLIDAGGAITGGADPGARVVVPWLALRRRTHLAAVVLSHPHPDHAGGLPAVLRALDVDELWDTGQGTALGYTGVYADTLRAARARRVPVRTTATLCGGPWRFHGATMEVLAPCPSVRDGTTANNGSFVLRISYSRARVLLPGDLERDGEAALLPLVGRTDVLKVGHHGSRTSTTAAWLDALRPRVALVSCGHPSPFGHPHPEVIQRLRERAVRVLRTDLSGAVSVTLHADGRVE